MQSQITDTSHDTMILHLVNEILNHRIPNKAGSFRVKSGVDRHGKTSRYPTALQNMPTNWCSHIHNNFIKFHNGLVFTNSEMLLKTINYLIAT